MSVVFRMVFAALLLAFAPIAAQAEDQDRSAVVLGDDLIPGKRVALVIGNSAYRHASPLPNPKNDAGDMAARLKALGFEVVAGVDLDRTRTEELVQQFAEKAEGADVTLFYYAGHGMQVDGRNYIIPVDAKLESRAALRFQTVDMDEVLTFMTGPKRVAIALLDACRDNPLSRRFAQTRSAGVGRGLAIPQAAGGGIMIGFATAPGETAADGDGRNSPFAAALLKHLGQPGIEIGQTMKRVMAEVSAATGDQQRPWVHSDIAVDFFMLPQAGVTGPQATETAVPAPAPAQEQVAARNTGPAPVAFGDVQVGMDFVSVVDKTQVLLELSVVNNGTEPVLAIVDDNYSSVALRGEAEPRRFSVQGVASCGAMGWNAADATAACIERATDNNWTLLEPGTPYELRLLTEAGNREVKADTLSTKIRLLLRSGPEWKKKDLSFARVPITR